MSEIHGNQPQKPQDPELTLAQQALKALCAEILALRPQPPRLTFESVATHLNPEAIQQRLRASALGDLMLRDGDTLSAAPASDYMPDLGLIAGQARLVGAEVRAWGWDDEKRRIDPSGPDTPPYDIIEYPGEKDWTHRLDISLRYSNGQHDARQTVTAYTASSLAGTIPTVSRNVSALAYADQGYEGHNQVSRPPQSDEEVLAFVALARELFDARIER